MTKPLRLRTLSIVLATFIAGCTSIAGLDDLEPTRGTFPTVGPGPLAGDASAGDGATSGHPDAASDAASTRDPGHPSTIASDGGTDGQTDAPHPVVTPIDDAGTDAGLDLCRLTGDCACDVKDDCKAPGFDCCNHRCTDTTSEPYHCGSCGNPCPATQSCQDGVCGCGGLEPDQACVPNVCIDYISDSDNCGSCKHACLGGKCLGAACQPVPIATQQDQPMSITVDGDSVYFVNSGSNSVVKLPKLYNGPCVGDACPQFRSALFDGPVGVATVDGQDLYVTNYASGHQGNLVRLKKTFMPGDDKVVSTGTGLWTVTLGGDGLPYWTARQDPHAVQFLNQVGTVQTLASATAGPVDVTALAVDGTSLFFATQTSVTNLASALYRIPLGQYCTDRSCVPMTTTLPAKPRSIYVTNDYVFWTSDDDKIRRLTKACTDVASCAVTILADGQLDPQGIVADKENVYWANAGDGTVRKASVYRTCRSTTCQSITPRLGQVFGLAQDGAALYVTTRTSGTAKSGIVWRIAK